MTGSDCISKHRPATSRGNASLPVPSSRRSPTRSQCITSARSTMQEVAVRHALHILQGRQLDFARVKCVDVGGSRIVFLVRIPEPPTAKPTFAARLRRRLRRQPNAPVTIDVTRNPILDAFSNVTLVDHGFTGDLLDSGTDLRSDF